jgi:uncharacterized protein HemX
LTQVATTPPAPTAAEAIKDTIKESFSRTTIMLGLVISLIGVTSGLGGPVYRLYGAQDKTEIEQAHLKENVLQNKEDITLNKRAISIERDANANNKEALGRLEQGQSDLKDDVHEIKILIRDLNRANWKK